MREIKVGIIGCGYWGPNLVRNFNDSTYTEVRYVCDIVQQPVDAIQRRYPLVRGTRSYRDILKDDTVGAVAIATPVNTHYEIAKAALEAGKHVFVEKPLTARVKEAEHLVEMALRKNLVLFVDHIYIYTNAVRRIRDCLAKGELGEIYYFDSVRINLGLFQRDINVIWDLAPHDLSIMDYFLDEKPVSIVATGTSHTESGFEDIAYITVRFKGSLIAHFHVNWMSPVKLRRIVIGGSRKMIVFDDLDPAEKIKIYDKGFRVARPRKRAVYQSLVQYRLGDMHAPSIENTEALKTAVDHFAECILHRKQPVTDGTAGLRIVRMLEATDRSLKKGGVKVAV